MRPHGSRGALSRVAVPEQTSPANTGAFLFACAGLYQEARSANVAGAAGAVKRHAGFSKLNMMSDDVESRRRRAAFRARHRGTKEMDWIIGRFADAQLPSMGPEELARFERLLQLPEPVVHDMIFNPEIEPAGTLAELIGQLRTFHGLG